MRKEKYSEGQVVLVSESCPKGSVATGNGSSVSRLFRTFLSSPPPPVIIFTGPDGHREAADAEAQRGRRGNSHFEASCPRKEGSVRINYAVTLGVRSNR